MAKVKAYVYVLVSGTSTLLRPGDEVPEGVTLTNPDVIDGETPAPEAEAPSEPETPETPAADEPETPAAPEPEPDPAPRKRTSRKAADS